ncbi:hypothetical protein EV424DRAFT_1341429 [Suillus variegatus]|nr:hypothetical protein EV424DRAFT_1341429 [Suillus variegatus]
MPSLCELVILKLSEKDDADLKQTYYPCLYKHRPAGLHQTKIEAELNEIVNVDVESAEVVGKCSLRNLKFENFTSGNGRKEYLLALPNHKPPYQWVTITGCSWPVTSDVVQDVVRRNLYIYWVHRVLHRRLGGGIMNSEGAVGVAYQYVVPAIILMLAFPARYFVSITGDNAIGFWKAKRKTQ